MMGPRRPATGATRADVPDRISYTMPLPIRVARVTPDHLVEGVLNIVVYGPGKGEAIVVRLPDGQYGVVDGCREPTPGSPTGAGDPVREFLAEVEAGWVDEDPLELAFVCLTHPHDDHYAGLGRLMAHFEGRIRRLWTGPLSQARWHPALMRWVETLTDSGEPSGQRRGGLDRVLAEYQKALGAGVAFSILGAGTVFPCGAEGVTIKACGPSAADALHALNKLRKFEGEVLKSASFDPNRLSGAVVIRWHDAAILLGGDMVNDGRFPNRGWYEACHHIDDRPVQVVNVAHHASAEAHHPPLWQRMAPRLAIVTPFGRAAGKQPPRPDMIDLLSADCAVAITSPPDWWAPAPGISRNPVLPVAPPPTYADRHNAVAVALDRDGTIRQIVLAGQAGFYVDTSASADCS